MLICPECRNLLKADSCSNCMWKMQLIGNTKVFLRTELSQAQQQYSDLYNTIAEDDCNEAILSDDYHKLQAKMIIEYVNLQKKDFICDVGSGKGYLLKALKEKGFHNLTAVDIAMDYLKLYENEISCILGDAEKLPFKNEFDVIFATDVLEHVLNVGSFLYSINQALKEDGTLVVRVPIGEDLMVYGFQKQKKYDFVHLRNFNKNLLVKIFKDAGFKIEKIAYEGYWTYSYKMYVENSKFLKKFVIQLQERIFGYKTQCYDGRGYATKIFCKLFMRPIEIVCIARKIKTL